jgi:hypothetical protein
MNPSFFLFYTFLSLQTKFSTNNQSHQLSQHTKGNLMFKSKSSTREVLCYNLGRDQSTLSQKICFFSPSVGYASIFVLCRDLGMMCFVYFLHPMPFSVPQQIVFLFCSIFFHDSKIKCLKIYYKRLLIL